MAADEHRTPYSPSVTATGATRRSALSSATRSRPNDHTLSYRSRGWRTVRARRVERDLQQRPTAGLQHPCDLVERGRVVGDLFDHVLGDEQLVAAGGGEEQVGRVGVVVDEGVERVRVHAAAYVPSIDRRVAPAARREVAAEHHRTARGQLEAAGRARGATLGPSPRTSARWRSSAPHSRQRASALPPCSARAVEPQIGQDRTGGDGNVMADTDLNGANPHLAGSSGGAGQGAVPAAGNAKQSLAIQMASRLGRDTAFYTAVGSVTLPIAFVNAIILNSRYLKPAEYGQLAVLFFTSGLLAVVLNLMFLRGTERQVWGAADEIVDLDDPDIISYEEKLRVLSSGLLLTMIACVLTILLVALYAPWLSEHLVHSPDLTAAVIWAGASGALGSVWRLVANTCRWERHRAGFGVVYTLRPALALALSWPLVASGKGVAGAMAAVAIATLGSIVVGLIYIRHSIRPVFSLTAARNIGRSSSNYAAMVIGLYVLHSGDTWFLSRVGKISDVGVYKLATNIASFISYSVSGFLMAWGPLERSSLFAASYDRYGHPKMRAEFMQYYLLVGIFLVLALVAMASPIISLFAPSYHPAEKFIPVTSVGYLAYGVILVVARGSTFPRRYVVYGVAAITGAIGLGVTSAILAPTIGGYGVALGDIVGGLAATAVILGIAAIWGHAPTVDKRRMLSLLLIGGFCYALSTWIAPLVGGTAEPVLKWVSVILFVALSLVSGAIPARHRRLLWQIFWAAARPRGRAPALLPRVLELPRTDRRIVMAITRDGETPARVSVLTGLPETSVRLRLVAALKEIEDVHSPPEGDDGIAEFLLDFDSVTAQDRLARELWEERGVLPGTLLDIESAFKALCGASPKIWAAAEERLTHNLNLESRSLDPTSLALLEEVVRRGDDGKDAAPRLGLDTNEIDRQPAAALRGRWTATGPLTRRTG